MILLFYYQGRYTPLQSSARSLATELNHGVGNSGLNLLNRLAGRDGNDCGLEFYGLGSEY